MLKELDIFEIPGISVLLNFKERSSINTKLGLLNNNPFEFEK